MSRQVQLVGRPDGEVTPEHFRVVDVAVPEPSAGEVLVENVLLSVDPYMRPKMDDVASYTPPYALEAPMDGGAAGVVVASADPDLPVGTRVTHRAGWREHALLRADEVAIVPDDGTPLSAHLGVLGSPGFTAWVGLGHVGGLREGDAVYVSAAAGAVGSIAGQIARLRGASRVVGSAGGSAKAGALVDELGFDRGIDHRIAPGAGGLAGALRESLPDGCDLYFDNVGGEHLAAALDVMNDRGRIVLCGAVSGYQRTDRGAQALVPGNLFAAIRKRLRLEGFIVSDHADLRPAFLAEVGGWLREGRLVARETVREGLESTPAALVDLLRGGNVGKMLVRLRDDPV